ncbi:agmatinase [Tropicibacter sp. R16_0]|uniref:agmatinase n=1 Tax=Tropicibacter sp. R16_0 TaxID=2821102 RepID=UPI001ADCF2C1|nr:agmatinase [Tropicibacter sp. R16_0]MBO9452647.1 agmatinase [Tropicibacter sp. R16_0]
MITNATIQDLEAGDVALMGVPLDLHSSFLQGPAFAPNRIREALHSGAANLTAEDGTDLGATDRVKDTGDLDVFEQRGPEPIAAIETGAGARIDTDARLLSLGGDHSVAYPLIKAHADRYEGLNVLHIDAHPDLYDQQDIGPLGHGCPFARVMETGKIKRLMQVGIRTMNAHQREQADRFGVEVVDMRNWHSDLTPEFDGPVYLSLDLDGLDPAFAPGVSHHEPGGLSTRDVIDLIARFQGQLIGADIVELNPHRDPYGITAMVAAKMVKEIGARLLR